jgi:copper chaperone
MTTTETTTEFQVSGMTCGHCEHAVSHEVGQIPGVLGVEVSAATGRLVIVSATPVSDEQVLAAVDEAGYQAVRIP